jgi:ORF 12 gene product N-terminal
MTGITGESATPALAGPATSSLVGEAGQAGRPRRVRCRRFAVVVSCVLAGSVLLACSGGAGFSSSSSARSRLSAAPPDAGTPAGAQLAWLLTATSHLPVSAAQLRAHFDAGFLAQVGPARVNQAFQAVGAVQVASVEVSQPRRFIATVGTGSGRFQMTLVVEARA